MTPEVEALARRAVACRGWRWMGGMRWIDNRPPPLEPIALRVADTRPRDGSDVPRHVLPDLTDPATLGCLLALVQEAWPGVVLRYDFGDERYNGLEYYTNEVAPHTFLVLRSPASLVAALEAAP